MKRKLNYTDRKKIKRENVSISFIREKDVIVAFSVNKLDVNDLKLIQDAQVYVEAYYRTELKRFNIGTVGKLQIPSYCNIKDMSSPENLRFRIIVVDPLDSKILAHASRIAPEEYSKEKSILPVEFSDLGNEIWTIKYEGDEDAPILILNSRIPNIQRMAKQDNQFFIHVYPQVIRDVLTYMVFVDGIESTIEPSVEWHSDWLKFVKMFNTHTPEILNKDDNNFNKEEVLNWINDTVKKFCDFYSNKFQDYIQKLEETQ